MNPVNLSTVVWRTVRIRFQKVAVIISRIYTTQAQYHSRTLIRRSGHSISSSIEQEWVSEYGESMTTMGPIKGRWKARLPTLCLEGNCEQTSRVYGIIHQAMDYVYITKTCSYMCTPYLRPSPVTREHMHHPNVVNTNCIKT